jgi:flagellar biosynthesis protein FlhG
MNQADTLEKIMNSQPAAKKFAQRPPGLAGAAATPRVISVTSGKGGVGKTNIVTNLAYVLSKNHKKVLVLDADLNLANVDILLGLTPRFNLHHVFTGEKNLADIVVKGPGGLHILPASSGVMELSELTEQQRLYFLAEMENLNRQFDILLIDTAAGINNNVVYFNLAAQERIVILTPEPTALTDAYALIKVLSSRHDVKKFRLLVNLARSEKEALDVYRKLSIVADRFLDTLSLDYLGYIPYDAKLPQAVRAQRLVADLYPDSQASRMFEKLSNQICTEEKELGTDGNIKFFWQGMLDL